MLSWCSLSIRLVIRQSRAKNSSGTRCILFDIANCLMQHTYITLNERNNYVGKLKMYLTYCLRRDCEKIYIYIYRERERERNVRAGRQILLYCISLGAGIYKL
jgi:hypothetical protein